MRIIDADYRKALEQNTEHQSTTNPFPDFSSQPLGQIPPARGQDRLWNYSAQRTHHAADPGQRLRHEGPIPPLVWREG